MAATLNRTHKAAIWGGMYVTRCGVEFYFYKSSSDWRRVTCKRCLKLKGKAK